MSTSSKSEALEKHKKGKKCHCGKEKGHEGKHKLGNVTFEKEGGDEAEAKREEHKDDEEE